MSNKLSSRIREFLIVEKKKHPQLSCRRACNMVERRFLVKISKSRINLLWKEKGLSQPVGRTPTKKPLPQNQFGNAGFAFLLAAITQLQAHKLWAETVQPIFPKQSRLDSEKMLQILLYRALFKNQDFWTIKGYNTKIYNILRIENTLEDCREEFAKFLSDFSLAQQEITSAELILKDKTKLSFDAQFHSLHLGSVPDNFSRGLSILKKDIERVFFQQEPLILFTIPGFSVFSQEVLELLTCFEGIRPEKALSQVKLYYKNTEKTIFSDIPAKKHYLIFGLWPWQYQIPAGMKPKGGYHHFWFPLLKQEFYLGESELSITQPITKQSITLRLIHIKAQKIGFPILTVGTNIPKLERKTKDIALLYLNQWPYIEKGYEEYLQLQKEKISNFQLTLPESPRPNLDSFLNYLLLTLSAYGQRHFLPPAFSQKDFPTLKQEIYNLPGRITYQEKTLFCEFLLAEGFEHHQELAFVCRRVNEANCELPGGIRLWLESACKKTHFTP